MTTDKPIGIKKAPLEATTLATVLCSCPLPQTQSPMRHCPESQSQEPSSGRGDHIKAAIGGHNPHPLLPCLLPGNQETLVALYACASILTEVPYFCNVGSESSLQGSHHAMFLWCWVLHSLQSHCHAFVCLSVCLSDHSVSVLLNSFFP